MNYWTFTEANGTRPVVVRADSLSQATKRFEGSKEWFPNYQHRESNDAEKVCSKFAEKQNGYIYPFYWDLDEPK